MSKSEATVVNDDEVLSADVVVQEEPEEEYYEQEEVQQRFNPYPYLIKIGGGVDYLEVKWRIVWLRSEHPDALIASEMVDHGPDFAVFRVKVAIPGGGSAIAHGSETAKDFKDFYEKAEQKALGRALASLGYGTQFTENENGEYVGVKPAAKSGGGNYRR